MPSTTAGTSLPNCADYATISYAKLLLRDAQELNALRVAAERDGFWHLDLSGQDNEPADITREVRSVFNAVHGFFALADHEKVEFDIDRIGPWKLNG